MNISLHKLNLLYSLYTCLVVVDFSSASLTSSGLQQETAAVLVEGVNTFTYLGVHTSEDLTCTEHIQAQYKKAW